MRRYFNVDWADSAHYDLVLNTERVSVAQCVEEILKLVRSPEFAETEASRGALGDVALQTHLRAALRGDPRTRGLRVAVSVSDRVATLSGLVDDEEQSATANEITAAIPGILRVANELRAHTRIRARNA